MSKTMKIPSRELVSYFGYGLGQCFGFGLFGAFINYFYTDVMGISAVTASTIFLIARVWDAVNDPIIAGIMDTVRSRFGKFRHYLLFTPFLITLVTIASFYNIEASMTTKIIYAGATYIFWGTLYSISDIPFWAISSVMSSEPKERAKAVTCAMLGVNAGISGASIIFPKLTTFFAVYSPNDKGYLYATITLTLLGLPLMINGFLQIKERVVPSEDKITLRDTMNNIRHNRPLFLILGAFFFTCLHNIAAGIYIYFFTYNLGNAGLQVTIGMIGFGAAMLCFITPVLTNYFRKRSLFIVLCLLDCIVRVILWFSGYDSLWLMFGLLGMSALFVTMSNVLTSAMIVDTIEYAEFKTHKRCAAITFSGQTFTGKMAVAVGGALVGIFLTLIHYVPQAEVQDEGVLRGLFFAVSLLPAIGSLIRIGFIWFFDFTEDKHAEVLEILKQRKQDISH
ncbi:melibiose:sodium symporter [Gammaproteobacteria bacterium]|nr:melibiose:sodium symporter [Gammaproteobacteria bacterium]